MFENRIKYIDKLSKKDILKQLVNLKQLTFELTDACNLQCKYCGYGELYSTHDKRENLYLDFSIAKQIIDYLYEIWNCYPSFSSQRIIVFGFYGGEPLLNMKLIKQIVSYLESLPIIPNTHFKYNMTTNAVLLDKYQDYLVEKNFDILISLDGDSDGHSYRIYKHGGNSFNKVYSNIKKLQQKYPSFFQDHVSFNSVLHDRNETHKIRQFIYSNFGKYPNISELNNFGIVKNKVEDFRRMFHRKELDIKISDTDYFDNSSKKMELFRIVKYLSGNYFYGYNSLLKTQTHYQYPSGTCLPFEKKMFITVRGKILACERIDQKYALGTVTPNGVFIDLEKVASLYTNFYKKMITVCKDCYRKDFCSQCIFYIPDIDKGPFNCPSFLSKKDAEEYIDSYIQILRQRPDLYVNISKMLFQS